MLTLNSFVLDLFGTKWAFLHVLISLWDRSEMLSGDGLGPPARMGYKSGGQGLPAELSLNLLFHTIISAAAFADELDNIRAHQL